MAMSLPVPSFSAGLFGYAPAFAAAQTPYDGIPAGSLQDQANALREMQQKWQATALFFQDQEMSSPMAYLPSPSALTECAAAAATAPAMETPKRQQSPKETKPYSPGELLAKSAECAFSSVDPDMRSECSTADTLERSPTPASPAQEPAMLSLSSALPVGVLSLQQALPEPALGTTDMPTMGSAGHRLGQCKPCAFIGKKGCANGVECQFCHLCDAGEKRRRLKAKKAYYDAIRQTLDLAVLS